MEVCMKLRREYRVIKEILNIYNKLTDDKSRQIFDARMQFMFDKDPYKYFDTVKEDKYYACEFETFYQKYKNRKIVLYGAGQEGRHTYKVLKLCGYNVDYFCDSNFKLWGTKIGDVFVLPLQDLVSRSSDYVIVISTSAWCSDIYEKLLACGIDREYLFYLKRRFIMGKCGWQYFDFFLPNNNEVFIDAGAYDGSTSIEFAKWTNKSYKKIILFEPSLGNETMCRKLLNENGIRDSELIMKAVWDKCEKVSFNGGGERGARVLENGEVFIEAASIDSELMGEEVSFIKMDVEGSEYKAIMGSETTIKKYKPRLAISVYHADEDFIKIPALLLMLNPDYQFAYRHYTTSMEETVLYAW
jgi:FkbM family methyltransferase